MDVLDWVAADINPCSVEDTGRKGLTVESVLRCAILKQYRQLTYKDLAFCLMDSASCQTFARLSMEWFPRKSVLQRCISAISDVTWERMLAIVYTRGQDKKARLYRDLIEVTKKSLGYVDNASLRLVAVGLFHPIACEAGQAQWNHYRSLILQVIDQTERRIFAKEKVPASEKIVSLFEEHSDIIVKGSRDVQYGHKINLSTGRSGLVWDVVIEAGNPADTARFLPMLDRHIEQYGKTPRRMAAVGGYASIENLRAAKQRQVTDVVFHKKRGLKVDEMAKSPWVYRKLRNFRVGIEAGISCLKRAYGLGRCTWKGLSHFRTYVWSSVVAHNLALYSRLVPT